MHGLRRTARSPDHHSRRYKSVRAGALKVNYQTWIELPPELRPSWWRQQFARPIVLLLRALYGHPEAGGLWELRKSRNILATLGSLPTHVDDLTLSGPQEEHQASLVDVEPP